MRTSEDPKKEKRVAEGFRSPPPPPTWPYVFHLLPSLGSLSVAVVAYRSLFTYLSVLVLLRFVSFTSSSRFQRLLHKGRERPLSRDPFGAPGERS
ncbi:hypothetical protein L596_007204 [Steinernema carpocapsae]|uniref:Transmembrane protein n=1 Tax=Steinernema carpocapsae TaxID=34508 RepID=A0A4U5P8M4_STECR|nr:hypothetical protein L596_007204 [Steinernema carpocapsae]